ncbi:Lycopene cyclase [Acaryochloris thomasi RCC1774]|uniref:Lycopene cyclase n=1 Tax=Acaryochloris thomasi RCC1774 TaxID=1764569 RepID=A0A2W1JGS1_9CYAN|nr:FAD-binding oxidoreductase [Acaryochloris thomasi]PZD72738.1 Lycopene cyclase [Acaryochloris thomasi RCC1774]
MSIVNHILGKLPGEYLTALEQADLKWANLRQDSSPTIPQVVVQSQAPLSTIAWDIIICGGTLGIIIGAALAQRGWRVALLERGILRGRDQEWNASRAEVSTLVDLGLLSPEQLEETISTEFNPLRLRFHGGKEIWVRDVLNLGINPVILLEFLKQRFLATGGRLLEQVPFSGVVIHPDGIEVKRQQGQPHLTARLLLDVMGHGSPIAAQARNGQKPDGICLVVGTCAQGMAENLTGDLLVSNSPIQNHSQYFWEAFPARDGRTTYLFTYADLQPQRPSLKQLFADYFQELPSYQEIELSQLQIQRALFGMFPSYRQSPLALPWDRLLALGDSSGNQSPLSFGGFGAMMRHLSRLDAGIHEALTCDCLTQKDLAQLQPYQPNLSSTWLFQKSMRAPINNIGDPNAINHLLSVVFEAMEDLGEPVLKPFLQDVVQFVPLSQALLQVSVRHPQLIPTILAQLGPVALAQWLPHYLSLGLYNELDRLQPLIRRRCKTLSPRKQYRWHRRLDQWAYGAGHDHRSNT